MRTVGIGRRGSEQEGGEETHGVREFAMRRVRGCGMRGAVARAKKQGSKTGKEQEVNKAESSVRVWSSCPSGFAKSLRSAASLYFFFSFEISRERVSQSPTSPQTPARKGCHHYSRIIDESTMRCLSRRRIYRNMLTRFGTAWLFFLLYLLLSCRQTMEALTPYESCGQGIAI